jgi:hypothetical protein
VQVNGYRVVQPYGVRPDEWTLIGEYGAVLEAFAALDALSAQMVRTGAPSDAVELIVVDDRVDRVARPGAQMSARITYSRGLSRGFVYLRSRGAGRPFESQGLRAQGRQAQTDGQGVVCRRQRMGGMLNFYFRPAA